jgi:endonuclease-3
MATTRNLTTIRRKLLKHQGGATGPMIDDPFHLILWEQVAYLVDDDSRHNAFRLLERRVGLSPAAILHARLDILTEIAASGGAIGSDKRANRMQESARRVMFRWSGDLKKALRLPVAQATRELSKFPMIGKPGAEKILLLTRAYPVLALDSNGLRVLLRLGYGTEGSRYEKTYESVRAAAAAEERAEYDWLILLHRLLRRHGQEVCRRKRPECVRCPLSQECKYYAEHFGL